MSKLLKNVHKDKRVYNGPKFQKLEHGHAVITDDDEASRLLRDFPDWFEDVTSDDSSEHAKFEKSFEANNPFNYENGKRVVSNTTVISDDDITDIVDEYTVMDLAALRQAATELGMTIKGNPSATKLRAVIREYKTANP